MKNKKFMRLIMAVTAVVILSAMTIYQMNIYNKEGSRDESNLEIKYIEIIRFKNANEQSSIDKTWKFENQQEILKIIGALENSEEIDTNLLELPPCEYEITVEYNSKHQKKYSLWLEEREYGLFKNEELNSYYTIEPHSTILMEEILQ